MKIINLPGAQDLTVVSTTKQHRLGQVCRATDDTLGDGEFIYLQGVASTVAGDAVIYNESYQTTRAVAASRGQVAVAVAPVVANSFGWYQIQGLATVNGAAVAADAQVYLTATDGNLDDAVVANQKIDGARAQSASGTPAAGQFYATLSFPAANGNG